MAGADMTDQEATPRPHNELRERARLIERDLMGGLISLVAFLDRKADDYERLLEVERAAKELADEMDRARARAWNAGAPAVWTDVVAGWAAALRRLVEPNKASA